MAKKMQYKDAVFRKYFMDKTRILSLYKAVTGDNDLTEDDIELKTLDSTYDNGKKNDVAFLCKNQLIMMFEHQSTINENMPVRFLLYLAEYYNKITKSDDRYRRKRINLPEPQCYIFYNGKKDLPERSILRLSDAYEVSSEHEETALELQVEVLNINRGKNQALMEKSPTLYQYSFFVDTVRKYESALPFEQAMERAIDECIGRGILSDFLQHNKAEVLRVCLFEYDQEKHIRQEKDESWEDCQTAINQLNLRLIADDRIDDLKRSAADTVYQKELLEEYELL